MASHVRILLLLSRHPAGSPRHGLDRPAPTMTPTPLSSVCAVHLRGGPCCYIRVTQTDTEVPCVRARARSYGTAAMIMMAKPSENGGFAHHDHARSGVPSLPERGPRRNDLARRHPDRAVEPDRLA